MPPGLLRFLVPLLIAALVVTPVSALPVRAPAAAGPGPFVAPAEVVVYPTPRAETDGPPVEIAPRQLMPVPEALEIPTRRNAGSLVIEDIQAAEITDLTIRIFGLVQGALTTQSLNPDPTPADPFDNLNDGTTFYFVLGVADDAMRLVSEVTASAAPDIDLFIGLDTGDNIPQAAEVVASGISPGAFETVSLDLPAAGFYWVLIQNVTGSASPPDDVTISTAVVPGTDSGNLTITGPESVPADTPFDLSVAWNMPGMIAGDRWYGSFDIGTDPANPGNVGSVDVTVVRHADDVTKSVNASTAVPGDTLTYTLTLQPNVTSTDLTYYLTDTIPAGLSYVPGSATGGATVSGNVLTWSGTLPGNQREYVMTTSDTDPACDTGFGGYVNLEDWGILADPSLAGDSLTFEVTWAGIPPIEYYDAAKGTTVRFTDDGFAFFDSTAGLAPWVNQYLPDPAAPNDLLAMYWRDLEIAYDEPANRGVSLASFGSGFVIEYDDVEPFPLGSTADHFDIEVVMYSTVNDNPGAPEIIFAYEDLAGDLSLGTIGLENVDGSQGVQYAYNDSSAGTLHDGLMICYDWAAPAASPVEVTYQVTVDPASTAATLTNAAVHNTDNPGSQPATASVSVSVEPSPAAVVIDDTSYTIQYDGWTGVEDAAAFGGGYRQASALGQKFVYRTPATEAITLITYRGPDQGQVRIVIDGQSHGVLDLYSPVPEYQHRVTYDGLEDRPHKIKIRVLGRQHADSSGAQVRIDGFEVNGESVDDDEPVTQYTRWLGESAEHAYGGSYRGATFPTATVTFSFTGTQFTWLTAYGPKLGQAEVIVDGIVVATVDLHSRYYAWQVPEVISGLTDGPHTVQIRALETPGVVMPLEEIPDNFRVVFDGYSVP